ncbi:hypothetical protein RB196_30885 [Streptomyces sp. PmtA]|uniref:hypothetical protein n=1 Tax=Streptomyces sp. PmtA TaxID=3074275 RepID=UPI003014D84A
MRPSRRARAAAGLGAALAAALVLAVPAGVALIGSTAGALLGDRRLPEQAESVIALLAPSLLAGLVVVALTGPGWTDLDGTLLAGVAVAACARLCRAPVPAAVLAGSWRRPCSDSSSAADRPPVPAAGGRGARPVGVSAAGQVRVDRGTAYDGGRCRPPWRRRVRRQTTAYAGPGRRPRPGGRCPVPCATARRTVAVAAAHPANG